MKLKQILWMMLFFLIVSYGGVYAETKEENKYATVKTSEGDITIKLDSSAAPLTVKAFEKYVKDRVYRKTSFDQVDPKFIMGGKPGEYAKGDYSKSGNCSYKKGPPPEFKLKHVRGGVCAVRTVGGCNPTKNSNSTQFVIYLKDKPENENEFTVFAKVVKGMDIVDKIGEKLKILKDQTEEQSSTKVLIQHIKITKKF